MMKKVMGDISLMMVLLLMTGCATYLNFEFDCDWGSGSDECVAIEQDDVEAETNTNTVWEGNVFTIPRMELTMIPIKPGRFRMGSDFGPPDEAPIHNVEISRGYWLGKTEVTWRQFSALMRRISQKSPGRDAFPAENISWHDAMAFCVELTAREFSAGRLPEGYAYRLPTEAEWEYAARAGTVGDYAGDLNNLGWYGDNSGSQAHSVGEKQPNAWGLHDMHGNVWEWCSDWYGEDVYTEWSRIDPAGPANGEVKSCRGGSWSWTARHCRSANRHWASAYYCGQNIGFRVALAPVQK